MIKGKVSNDAGAQEPGTQLCAAQATIVHKRTCLSSQKNYPSTEHCLGLLILKDLKESNCFQNSYIPELEY